jgi:hypothetical protein
MEIIREPLQCILSVYLQEVSFMHINIKIWTLLVATPIIIFSCRKHADKPSATRYTYKLGGAHNWSGIGEYSRRNNGIKVYDTSYNVIDSSAITVLNDRTIKIGDFTLPFVAEDDSVLAFKTSDFRVHGLGYLMDTITVNYNYITNVITYEGTEIQDGSGIYMFELHSP